MKAKLSTKDPSDWFVYWRDESGKLFKKRAGINRHKSLRKRREQGKLLCEYINKLLASGSLHKPTAKDILDNIVTDRKGSLRRRSWQSYKYAADMLTSWLPDPSTTMEEITKSVARQFVDHLIQKGYKGKTINGIRGFLTALFNHYAERNEGYVNPFKGTPKQLQESGRNVAFTDEQMHDVWNKLDANLLLFTRFIYFTYIRPIELLRLKVSDIRMDIGEVIIQGHQSKNKRQQSVVIPDVFLEEIKAMGYDKMPSDWYLFGRGLVPGIRPLGRNAVSKMHSKVLRDMGYHSDLTLYSWKHTGVVQAYRKGIDIYSIMRQLRHHSLEMTQIYLKSLGLVRNEQFGRLMR